MAALSAWFWNERFWLPHNVTWADLADPAPGVEYPKAGHLFTALPLALGIFAVRILFERFVLAAHVGCFLVRKFRKASFNGRVFFHISGMMGFASCGWTCIFYCVLTFLLSNTTLLQTALLFSFHPAFKDKHVVEIALKHRLMGLTSSTCNAVTTTLMWPEHPLKTPVIDVWITPD